MPKEQFDFSKPEDQEQFEALPEEAKETLVENAQEGAQVEDMRRTRNKIRNESIKHVERMVEEAGVKKGDYILVKTVDKDSYNGSFTEFSNDETLIMIDVGFRQNAADIHTRSIPFENILSIKKSRIRP